MALSFLDDTDDIRLVIRRVPVLSDCALCGRALDVIEPGVVIVMEPYDAPICIRCAQPLDSLIAALFGAMIEATMDARSTPIELDEGVH